MATGLACRRLKAGLGKDENEESVLSKLEAVGKVEVVVGGLTGVVLKDGWNTLATGDGTFKLGIEEPNPFTDPIVGVNVELLTAVVAMVSEDSDSSFWNAKLMGAEEGVSAAGNLVPSSAVKPVGAWVALRTAEEVGVAPLAFGTE